MHGGRTMKQYSEAFVGFDTAKKKHAVAIADVGREGEIRYLGEIDSSPAAVERMIRKLAGRYEELHFCYEAGPTGYGLYRQVLGLGPRCTVVAPSLIPKKSGERIKTNRRDAVTLARLFRAGELTSVWVPDTVHEAVRDLVRAREAASQDLRRKRQQLLSFLLRHGRIFSGRQHWSRGHLRCLDEQVPAIVPSWSMAPVVEAYQAMRGVSFVVAVTFVAEIGDLRRFDNPRQLMAFLGLVPSERSTGERIRRAGLTLAGNKRARRVLIEGAWSYRYPARVSQTLQARLEGLPKAVRQIAWKAQIRLCARYRRLNAASKKRPVVIAAIAREMAAFLWAIARHVAPAA